MVTSDTTNLGDCGLVVGQVSPVLASLGQGNLPYLF